MFCRLPTGVLSPFVTFDEAGDEQDQDKQGDGTHQTNEPALCGDVHLLTWYYYTSACEHKHVRGEAEQGEYVKKETSGSIQIFFRTFFYNKEMKSLKKSNKI